MLLAVVQDPGGLLVWGGFRERFCPWILECLWGRQRDLHYFACWTTFYPSENASTPCSSPVSSKMVESLQLHSDWLLHFWRDFAASLPCICPLSKTHVVLKWRCQFSTTGVIAGGLPTRLLKTAVHALPSQFIIEHYSIYNFFAYLTNIYK